MTDTTPTTPAIERLMAARQKLDACEVNANGDRLIDNHGDELGRFPDCPDLAQFASLAFDNVEAVAAEMKALQAIKDAAREYLKAIDAEDRATVVTAMSLYIAKSKADSVLRALLKESE